MYSEKDVVEILSKVTDKIKVEKLTEEGVSKLLKSNNKSNNPVGIDDTFNSLLKLFNDKMIRTTAITPLDNPKRCLLSIIYIKPIEDVSAILQKYTFRSIDKIISTIEDTRYVLDIDYFKLELIK